MYKLGSVNILRLLKNVLQDVHAETSIIIESHIFLSLDNTKQWEEKSLQRLSK